MFTASIVATMVNNSNHVKIPISFSVVHFQEQLLFYNLCASYLPGIIKTEQNT